MVDCFQFCFNFAFKFNLRRYNGGKYKLVNKLEIMPVAVQESLATKYHFYGTWPSTGVLAIVYCLENYPAGPSLRPSLKPFESFIPRRCSNQTIMGSEQGLVK